MAAKILLAGIAAGVQEAPAGIRDVCALDRELSRRPTCQPGRTGGKG